MTPVINVEGLSKRYTIGALESANRSLRETIAAETRAFFARLAGGAARNHHAAEIWALKDVTFSVMPGESIGVVGHNGAGKSTLLKILARITEPTEGRVRLRGRAASLLEVGTGFHGDLTGRENIFLNGAILGMSKSEILRKFDDIVGFAEVEQFIDTPVKHYSSGMYMRLAFAVAAHLDPEILIVDEVLAVGDLAFQRKCLGKLQAVTEEGRTVIFVSHNMGAVSRLCTRGILLESGRIAFIGGVEEVTRRYSGLAGQTRTQWLAPDEPLPAPKARILEVTLCDERGNHQPAPTTDDTLGIRIAYELPDPLPGTILAIAVYDQMMTPLFATSPFETDTTPPDGPGIFRWSMRFTKALFMQQTYYVTAALYRPWQELHVLPAVLSFSVVGGPSTVGQLPGGKVGSLHLDCAWKSIEIGAEHPALPKGKG